MFTLLRSLFASSRDRSSVQSALQQGLLVNAYCTSTVVAQPPFAHALHGWRDHGDPGLAAHLQGLIGYIAAAGDGAMSQVRYHLIRHVQRTRQQLSFSVDEHLLDKLGAWARDSNAILFLPDGSIRDPWGRMLLSADGSEQHPAAAIPFPAAAWERQSRSLQLLQSLGLLVPGHLPPVIAESELHLRPVQEVAGRALALFVVALRAESLVRSEPIEVDELRQRMPEAFGQLSAQESAFLASQSPDVQDITNFVWRYESLNVLAWALGLLDDLPFPGDVCDVPLLAGALMQLQGQGLAASAVLRDASEILDALDLHFRLHWLVRQSRIAEEAAALQGVEAGVVYERHHALNWLVRFEDSDWDEVDTPT